jgi:hypothetical protein
MQQGLLGQWWRLGGALGIAFIVIFMVIGFGAQGETPFHSDDVAEIRAYWEDDGEAYLLGDYVIGLAVLLLYIPFLCAFRLLLGQAEGGVQLWSRVAFTAGFLFVVIAATAATAWTALAFAASELDDESVRLLMYVDFAAWNAAPFAVGTMLLASSLVIYQTGVLWRWLAILGAIVGVCALIAPAGIIGLEPTEDPEEGIFSILGLVTFLGFAIWLLLTSIAMVMRKEEPAFVASREM